MNGSPGRGVAFHVNAAQATGGGASATMMGAEKAGPPGLSNEQWNTLIAMLNNQQISSNEKLPFNGKPIAESMVIVEYIDETFEGLSILPKDPYDRALARFWAKFLDDKVLYRKHREHGILFIILYDNGEEQEKGKEEVWEMLKILDNELKDKKFFVNDKFGFADIAANFMGLWLGLFQEGSGVVVVTSEKFPNFCAWRDEFFNCSQVKKYLPPRDELLAFFKAFLSAASSVSKKMNTSSFIL
ncbi:probable glutathione S-transferase [Lycium ferocissimum]|uniref:probable glutathione S-transferase n=1 Tax=Lycium ferocissimum TaxID=112874 RepID=UPI0028151181|nr:probable glutathione S-transferase [Lycium ferocissimum]